MDLSGGGIGNNGSLAEAARGSVSLQAAKLRLCVIAFDRVPDGSSDTTFIVVRPRREQEPLHGAIGMTCRRLAAVHAMKIRIHGLPAADAVFLAVVE